MDEHVELELDSDKGIIFIRINDHVEAKMTFSLDNNHKMVILHTEVNKENNGKGYGKKLLMKAVEFARVQNLKIIPICPFAKRILLKITEFSDVI